MNVSEQKEHHQATDQKLIEQRKKDDYVTLVAFIIENSTVIPFRWHCSKYVCFFCCCPFEESSKLIQHYKEEHTDAKVRNAFRNLIKNSKIKLEISEITCKSCRLSFAELDELIEHFVAVHKIKLNVEMKKQLFTYKISDDNLFCHRCGEQFRSFGTLLKHTHAKHNMDEAYVCEICGQSFIAKANVASHVKSVHAKHRTLDCQKCNITFKSMHTLQVHVSRVHSANSLKCPKCPEIFETFYWKKKHLATVHDVKRYKYECELCNIIFTCRSKIENHKSRVHLKERTLQCEYCPYKAYDKMSLKRHMVSHDDTRPYQCEFCKKAFQRKKTWELHRRIHTNDRRYSCKDCGKAFVQYTSLKLHYRVHHSKDAPSWK